MSFLNPPPSPPGTPRGPLALGVDPGMHHTGLALVSSKKILGVRLVRVPKKTTGVDAVVGMTRVLRNEIRALLLGAASPDQIGVRPQVFVVEGQQVYRRSDQHRVGTPEQLLQLAQVAGAALAGCLAWDEPKAVYMPLPSEWKGSVSKGLMNNRVLDRFGLAPGPGCLDGVPGAQEITPAQQEHVLDAAGLAHWGLVKFTYDEMAREVLAHGGKL